MNNPAKFLDIVKGFNADEIDPKTLEATKKL
jgi:hypothetical protein